jgi:small subunit ribosomal protein S11
MAAEDCSKVALEAGLKKVKVYVKDQETDVSLLFVLGNGGIEVTEIIDVNASQRMSSSKKRRRILKIIIIV